jgi:beta-glucosidase
MTETIDFTAPKFNGEGAVGGLASNVRFGAATAAFQIEGATHADGRGESIWDRFCRTPGKVANGDTGDVACEHYRRFEADLDLMAALGLESYRFSIAWPRVQPSGRGPVNFAGLRFYRELAEGLRARGIEPIATLYHWDLPQALQDEGGWAARDTAALFAEYAAVCGDALGDVVTQWITHNEPWVVAFLGHAAGVKAPGMRDWPTALRVSHHLLLSHGLATQALRSSAAGPDVDVGIALNLAPVHAAGPGEDHRAAALRMDGHLNRWFLDPILRGRYPDDMLDLYERLYGGPLADQRNGDLPVIAEPIDFLGVNYYFPQRVFAAPQDGPLGLHHAPAPPPTTTMGWEVDPGGLHELLMRLRRDFGPLPVYITENGASFDDPPEEAGLVEDPQRTAYLRGHLEALARAVADGADVRRYCVWSLLDNFEWEHGYDKRFGIVHVDYRTQRRSLKRSGLWYRDFIGWMRRLRA